MTVRYIHPLLRPWLTAVPPWLTLAVWLLLTADSFFTVRLLLQYHDIDLLGWKTSCAAAPPPDLSVHKSFTRCRSICS